MLPTLFFILQIEMGEISEADFTNIVESLAADELKQLYKTLGIQINEEVEKSLSARKTMMKKSVLRTWKQTNTEIATRHTILMALDKCGNTKARKQLYEQWLKK